jgi:hypothetical protein
MSEGSRSSCRHRPVPPIPVAALLFAAASMAFLPGCGDRPIGGGGSVKSGAGIRHVVLRGSPHEIGLHQGRLLRDEIRSLHGAWLERLLRSAVGPGGGDLATGAAGKLQEQLEGFVDVARGRLPEATLQELDGLAEATGLAADRLLLFELMHDALRVRVTDMEPRLPAALAAGYVGSGGVREARGWWRGPDAPILAPHWLLIERHPEDGMSTVVLSWPGSVGGILGVSAGGQAYLLGEARSEPDVRGFGKGVPIPVAARVALELGVELPRFVAEVGGSAGHVLLCIQEPGGPRAALGSVALYRGTQGHLDLEDRPLIVQGPMQGIDWGLHQLQWFDEPAAGWPPSGPLFEKAQTLLDRAGFEQAAKGPEARMRFQQGSILLEVRLPDGRGATVRLTKSGEFESGE